MKYLEDLIIKRARQYINDEPNVGYKKQILYLVYQYKSGNSDVLAVLYDRLISKFNFGTAGLRGAMEGGYSRINYVTFSRLGWALGMFLLSRHNCCSVIIGYDARFNGLMFSKILIKVLNALGIKVFIISAGIPTPFLSYIIMKLRISAGIMITASHNKYSDNGCKIYLNDGIQIHREYAEKLVDLMYNAPSFELIKKMFFYINYKNKLYNIIYKSIIESYFIVLKNKFNIILNMYKKNINIMYSPLHGIGYKYVCYGLKKFGFLNFNVVNNQKCLNGLFPTVKYPNPENFNVLINMFKLYKIHDFELSLVNDPDVDRLSVMICMNKKFILLNGNEIGILLGYYILKYICHVVENFIIVTTLTSTRMLFQLARSYNVQYIETFNGFSHIIHNGIMEEKLYNSIFVFAFEEALGYCIGNSVRDKDGISAAIHFANLFSILKSKGQTVFNILDDLFIKYGYYKTLQWSYNVNCALARLKMLKIINFFKYDMMFLRDLCNEFIIKKSVLKDEFGCFNILVFFTNLHTRIIIRPSGTEAKIKFYVEVLYKVNSYITLSRLKKHAHIKLNMIKKILLSQINLLIF